MNLKEFAQKINELQLIDWQLYSVWHEQAKELGIIICYVNENEREEGGISHTIDIEGAIVADYHCDTESGAVIDFTNDGKWIGDEELSVLKHYNSDFKYNTLEAFKEPKRDGEKYAEWAFETEIPHETFNVMNGTEVFCQGIVFLKESLV